MDADFCVVALEDAINRYGVPEIFNTDQGSQFTSYEFTKALREAGARISMDGRGRWMDNVMIERLWRSLKYECLYLREIGTGSELRRNLACSKAYVSRALPLNSGPLSTLIHCGSRP